MVQYDMLWYGMVLYNMLWYGMIWLVWKGRPLPGWQFHAGWLPPTARGQIPTKAGDLLPKPQSQSTYITDGLCPVFLF